MSMYDYSIILFLPTYECVYRVLNVKFCACQKIREKEKQDSASSKGRALGSKSKDAEFTYSFGASTVRMSPSRNSYPLPVQQAPSVGQPSRVPLNRIANFPSRTIILITLTDQVKTSSCFWDYCSYFDYEHWYNPNRQNPSWQGP